MLKKRLERPNEPNWIKNMKHWPNEPIVINNGRKELSLNWKQLFNRIQVKKNLLNLDKILIEFFQYRYEIW